MRRAVILVALAACASPRKAAPPDDAAPAVAVVPPAPPDAAKELPIVQAWDAFDFRQVPLEPAETIGKDERCLVGSIEPHETSTRIGCLANAAIALVDVDGVVRAARDQMLLLRIEAAGDKPVAARARLRGVEGRLAEPEPPSRCDCREEIPEPEPPETYDFSRIRKDKAWGKREVCRVNMVREVVRVDPTAADYTVAGSLDPAVVTFGVEVYCDHVRIHVGSKSAVMLLRIAQGQYIDLEPWWMGHDEPPTAVIHGIRRDVPSRH